jgi:hypothetical protein
LHPDNTKDRESKQRVLQYKITNSMKQDPVPDKLKDDIKVRTVPLQARMPKPVVRFAEADDPPSDKESVTDDTSPPSQEDRIIDSAVYDYPLPHMANSALIQDGSPMLDVKCQFKYQALQE